MNSTQVVTCPHVKNTNVEKMAQIIKQVKDFRKRYPQQPRRKSNLQETSPNQVYLDTSKITQEELELFKSYSKNKINKLAVGFQIRAKMIDWFIEIVYKCNLSDRTYFLAIFYLDLYLSKSKYPYSSEKFHLIGIAIIFCAMKYQEVYPLRIQDVYERIGHCLYTTTQIIQAEAQFLNTIEFKLSSMTIDDCISFIMDSCKFIGDQKIPYNLLRICRYYSKALTHFQSTLQIDMLLTGMAIVYLAMKSIEKLRKLMGAEKVLEQFCGCLSLGICEVRTRGKQIIEKIRRFKVEFEQLNNLERFNFLQH